MTLEQRNAEILRLIKEHTKRSTTSKKAARSALIETGIYTKAGKLRVEYGGTSKKQRKTA